MLVQGYEEGSDRGGVLQGFRIADLCGGQIAFCSLLAENDAEYSSLVKTALVR
jgi:hypothetical protein